MTKIMINPVLFLMEKGWYIPHCFNGLKFVISHPFLIGKRIIYPTLFLMGNEYISCSDKNTPNMSLLDNNDKNSPNRSFLNNSDKNTPNRSFMDNNA